LTTSDTTSYIDHVKGQVWATSFLPNTAARKDAAQKEYLAKHGKPLLVDYVELELKEKSRIVVENDHCKDNDLYYLLFIISRSLWLLSILEGIVWAFQGLF